MPGTDDELATYRKTLELKKREATLEGLFRLARLLNELALDRLRIETGNPSLRSAHTALLPHIALEGTRLTTLAERVGISKQAVGQLLDELEADGAIERVPDPDDGRAKLVRFSRKGRAGLLAGLAQLQKLEAELAHELGHRRWSEFQNSVFELLAVVQRWHSAR